MKKQILILSLFILIVFSLATCKDSATRNILTFTLLQTSDLHNHAGGYGAALDYTPDNLHDNDGVLGGFSRLASLIAAIRNEQAEDDIPVVVVDSGDFFMGTVYDLAASDPMALKFFQMVGYDAVTLGNHEFDWSHMGLTLLLSNGIATGFDVPIIATNMVTSSASAADDGLEAIAATGAIVDKKVIILENGLRIGLLGIMGTTADSLAPAAAPITFNHDFAFLQSKVDELRNTDGVDIVILLSHGGVTNDGTGDDAIVAENVTGIDVIASGHYHTATQSALTIGPSNTLIFSPGEYGKFLSRLDVRFNTETMQIESADFKLLPVDDTVQPRTVFNTVVEEYKDNIDAALVPLGLSLDAPISRVSEKMEIHGAKESALGNLSADALRAVANSLAPLNDGNPYQIAVIPNGVIRDGLFPGKTGVVSFTDVYNAIPLGTSPDTTQPLPGYPLMSFYLIAADIRNACEAGITLSQQMGSDFFLNFSGIRVDYNPAGAPLFQGVTAVYLCGVTDFFTTTPGPAIDLTDTTTLYKVVVDLYALQMMNVVTSMGLNIVPRDSAGNPIPPDQYMLYRIDSSVNPGIQELKEWQALLSYLSTFFPATGEGIPTTVYGAGGIGMNRIQFQ